MKKITLFAFLSAALATSIASAQTGDQLKEMALSACETQVAQVPEAQRELYKKTCACTVENTDYDAIIADSQSGNTAKVQKDALAVAQKMRPVRAQR